ncbi:MAG: ATP-binding protein, partial [Lachnospiraceae bacterium]|nr:ATP-binding protein [Lachnospiraceae bacterium]
MIDVLQIKKYKENNRIEAKKAMGGLPKSIWETYSAFANTLGGVILLGVEEYKDKSLHPVNLPDPEGMVEEFWRIVNHTDKVSVNILSATHVRIETVEGNRIIVITVPRAERYNRPVYIDKDPFSGAYRRNGEGDYRCTPEEIEAMLRDAVTEEQDARILEAMLPEAFDGETVDRYRDLMEKERPDHPWETLMDLEFLHELG